jgi:hypothetical protein
MRPSRVAAERARGRGVDAPPRYTARMRGQAAAPILALAALSCAPERPAVTRPMAVAPTQNPCPRTVLAPHAFEAGETATPGQQGLVGAVTDASTKMRLQDAFVTVQCVASHRDLDVGVTDEDGWFRMLADSRYGRDCDELAIRFERESYYSLEETVSTHPDTTVEMRARLVQVPAACRPVAVPVLAASYDPPAVALMPVAARPPASPPPSAR